VILTDPVFWITILIFVILRVYLYFSIQDPPFFAGFGGSDMAAVTIIGTFLAFLLKTLMGTALGFLNSCVLASRSLRVYIIEMAMMTKNAPKLPQERARYLVRLFNAAHLLNYVGKDGPYQQNFFEKINTEHDLLSREEIRSLPAFDGAGPGACTNVLAWMVQEINRMFVAGYIDGQMAGQMRQIVMNFRGKVGFLNNHEPPIPFVYLHLLSTLVTFYVPLFGLCMAIMSVEDSPRFTWTDVVSIVGVTSYTMLVLGIRMLTISLTDCYGDELQDCTVLTYILSAVKGSDDLMNSKGAPQIGVETKKV